MSNNYKKIVVIGGGTGTFTVLQGLKNFPFDITAIVSTADDGGSSGQLRDELGVLPPGDIRQALVALSKDSTILRELFNYRYETGTLKGYQFGNLFLSSLEKITGSLDKAIIEVGKILAINGRVIPVTRDNVRLFAKSNSGKIIQGQHSIDEYIWSEKSSVGNLWLEPDCQLHPEALKAILRADIITIGPGSVFTSLIPNLLVGGMQEALEKTKSKIILITNLMTEKGQTSSYYVQDFVSLIESYLGKRKISLVLYNDKKPSQYLLQKYIQEMERRPVEINKEIRLKNQLIGLNLLGRKIAKLKNGDALSSTRSLIRHDSAKLAEILFYIGNGRDIHNMELK